MPFTIRQLLWMANSRRRTEWQYFSSLEALYINSIRKEHAKKVHPDELNPFIKKKKRQITGAVAWDLLRKAVEGGAFGKK